MKKVILFLFTSMLILACSSDDSSADDGGDGGELLSSRLGVWEGTGTQPGLSWTIKITLGSSEQLIEYPSLACGGFLTLVSESSTELLFRETITVQTTCADQGFVKLTATSATTMDYDYYFPNASNEVGQLAASGSVTKTE